MSKYYDNFRRTTCDVYNPNYDRRKRYGADAVELLKRGTAIYEFTQKDIALSIGSVYWYIGDASGSAYTTRGFGAEIIENSAICEPVSWRERVRFAVGRAHGSELIDQMIESGALTPAQVEQAAIANNQEDTE